jgi:hydroxyacylglutathione hydrolase
MQRRFSSQFLGLNSSVVYQGNYAYLVDPGVFPREIEKIRLFLKKENIDQLTVLLTHTHGDHIAGWNFFREYPTYGHASIQQKPELAKQNDVRYLKGMWRKHGVESEEELLFPDNVQYVEEGETIQIPPFSFTFYYIPGHSVDMSAIVIPEEKLLFSGDCLIQTPVPFVLHSTRQYWDSLKKLKYVVFDDELRCLIPGHGKPANSYREIMERIESEQKYLQELIWEGIKLGRTGLPEKEISDRLLNHSNRHKRLHAHQSNVQTFMREINDWLQDETLDLEIEKF